MTRVGQFIQSIDVASGGTSTAFLNTVSALRTRADVEVHAYAAPPPVTDPAAAAVAADPDRWTCVPGYGRGLRPGALGRAVVADVRAGRLDLLHIHGLWSPDLLAVGLACRRLGVPYVWQPHGMLVREAYAQKRLKKEVFMAAGMRRVLRGAGALVFVTGEERDHSLIPRGIGAARVRVVPLSVAMPRVGPDAPFRAAARARFGVPPDAPCVVYMGRLHPVKRVEMILEAAALLSARRPDLRVLLFGGGDEAYVRTLRNRIAGAGLADRAVLAGWVQGEDKWSALAAGDVLTLNSVHENFGYVAVEALCVGTRPVLTSNLALAEQLRTDGVAEAAEPDAPSLALAWERGMSASDQRTREIGRAWVADHLSLPAVATQLVDLYAWLLAAPGGRASSARTGSSA